MGKHKCRFLIKQRAALKVYLIHLAETDRLYGTQYLDVMTEEFNKLGYNPVISEIYKSFYELVDSGILVRREERMEGKKRQKIIIYNIKDREKANLYKKQVKADLDRCRNLIGKIIKDVYGSLEEKSEPAVSESEHKSKFLIKQRAVLIVYLIHLAETNRIYGTQYLDYMRQNFSVYGYNPEMSEVYKSLHELEEEGALRSREERLEDKKYKKIVVYTINNREKATQYKNEIKLELERCYALLGKIINDVYGSNVKKKSAQLL